MVHMCKMIISPASFFIFSIFFFFWRGGGGGDKIAKKQTKMTKKFAPHRVHISGTIHNMIVVYGTLVQSDNISTWFSHSKFLIFRVVRAIKVQKMVQNDK